MAQQDLNPSAPPEEVDDFQWIEDSMNNNNKTNNDDNVYPVLNQNNNDNENNDNQPQQEQQQIQGFVQPTDMAIPDAITQQVIYQKIMEEQRKKKEAEENAQKLEQKQDPPQQQDDQKQFPQKQPSAPKQEILQQENDGLNVLNGPKPSYMDQNVQYPETALYKAAGLCVWRPKENGKGIQIMMGLEKTNNTLSFFGGKRDNSDKTCVDTAIREFHEETGKKLDDETLTQVL